jgi:hypothetical protein
VVAGLRVAVLGPQCPGRRSPRREMPIVGARLAVSEESLSRRKSSEWGRIHRIRRCAEADDQGLQRMGRRPEGRSRRTAWVCESLSYPNPANTCGGVAVLMEVASSLGLRYRQPLRHLAG